MSVAEQIVEDLRQDTWKDSISESVNQLIDLTHSGEKAVTLVTDIIARDAALTEKVLEAANSSHFKHRVREPIKTVAHAVLLLGLDTTRQLAMALSLMDKLFEPEQRAVLHGEMARAVLACSLAGKLMDEVDRENRDVPEVATLVRGLGRLVTAAYAYSEYQEINRISMEDGADADPEVAVLGLTFDELAKKAANQLALPLAYSSSMNEPYAVQVAQLTTELAQGLATQGLSLNEHVVAGPLEAMVETFSLPRSKVVAMAESAMREFEGIKAALKSRAEKDARLARLKPRAPRRAAKPADVATAQMVQLANADLNALSAKGANHLNIARIGVELLKNMGDFRNVVYCETIGLDTYQARAGAGPAAALSSRMWVVHIESRELFGLAMQKGASIHLGNAKDQKLVGKLPQWMEQTFGMPGSFLFIPTGVGQMSPGFIYCDQARADVSVSEKVQSAIKTIKSCMSIALEHERCVTL